MSRRYTHRCAACGQSVPNWRPSVSEWCWYLALAIDRPALELVPRCERCGYRLPRRLQRRALRDGGAS